LTIRNNTEVYNHVLKTVCFDVIFSEEFLEIFFNCCCFQRNNFQK